MNIKVKALNWLTAEEPSGRWGLLRDVMEDKDTTKVLLLLLLVTNPCFNPSDVLFYSF